MAKIRILDDITINKIAAGEVIENPASVVKELIENAIDAGATEIHLETKAGGRGLIKVADNGCGMNEDDLLLSVERHATSKLIEVEQLNSLKTLGFRGEALPSIASVSRMSLHSATVSGGGHLVEISGGKLGQIAPYPRRMGTTIEVKSLFYNVPVRKKFQKSIGWDTGEINKVVTLFALSYLSLGFSWINDEKSQFNFLKNGARDDRVKILLGEEFSANAFPVEHTKERLFLEGRICRPSVHRPNRTGQYLFINSRAVTSPFVARKILEGYGTRLSNHRFPLFVLNLSLPPSWIDVNVHPQKKEVRIREEGQLGPFILEAIESSLEKKEGATPLVKPLSGLVFPPLEEACFTPAQTVSEPLEIYESEETSLFIKPEVLIVAKINQHFFVQEAQGIRIVNGARALERVVFDGLNEKKGRQAVQTLLLPIQLSVGGKEKFLLLDLLDQLNEKGIGIRHFGGDSFMIDAIPALLEPHEITDLIFAYLHEGEVPKDLGKCLKRSAMTKEMGRALIEKLFRSNNSEFTPNGKRIHYLLDENELKKLLS